MDPHGLRHLLIQTGLPGGLSWRPSHQDASYNSRPSLNCNSLPFLPSEDILTGCPPGSSIASQISDATYPNFVRDSEPPNQLHNEPSASSRLKEWAHSRPNRRDEALDEGPAVPSHATGLPLQQHEGDVGKAVRNDVELWLLDDTGRHQNAVNTGSTVNSVSLNPWLMQTNSPNAPLNDRSRHEQPDPGYKTLCGHTSSHRRGTDKYRHDTVSPVRMTPSSPPNTHRSQAPTDHNDSHRRPTDRSAIISALNEKTVFNDLLEDMPLNNVTSKESQNGDSTTVVLEVLQAMAAEMVEVKKENGTLHGEVEDLKARLASYESRSAEIRGPYSQEPRQYIPQWVRRSQHQEAVQNTSNVLHNKGQRSMSGDMFLALGGYAQHPYIEHTSPGPRNELMGMDGSMKQRAPEQSPGQIMCGTDMLNNQQIQPPAPLSPPDVWLKFPDVTRTLSARARAFSEGAPPADESPSLLLGHPKIEGTHYGAARLQSEEEAQHAYSSAKDILQVKMKSLDNSDDTTEDTSCGSKRAVHPTVACLSYSVCLPGESEALQAVREEADDMSHTGDASDGDTPSTTRTGSSGTPLTKQKQTRAQLPGVIESSPIDRGTRNRLVVLQQNELLIDVARNSVCIQPRASLEGMNIDPDTKALAKVFCLWQISNLAEVQEVDCLVSPPFWLPCSLGELRLRIQMVKPGGANEGSERGIDSLASPRTEASLDTRTPTTACSPRTNNSSWPQSEFNFCITVTNADHVVNYSLIAGDTVSGPSWHCFGMCGKETGGAVSLGYSDDENISNEMNRVLTALEAPRRSPWAGPSVFGKLGDCVDARSGVLSLGVALHGKINVNDLIPAKSSGTGMGSRTGGGQSEDPYYEVVKKIEEFATIDDSMRAAATRVFYDEFRQRTGCGEG